jgi:hypothetical protein
MLLLSGQAAYAQEQRYRVELLVLRQLEGYSTQQPAAALEDFSAAMDLLAPPAENSLPDQAELSGSQSSAQAKVQAVAQPAGQTGNQSGDQPPVVLQETPGEVMQQAWRRLRSANGLRPELYFSWEQAASAGAPKVRVHDQTLLFEQEPIAGLPDASIVRYYRLDGTARLRVSRFLHLDLDIQYREPAEAGTPQAVAMSATSASTGPDPGTPTATAHQVYTIRQSRQVQIQELHYFDGPVIAVLAVVSRVEPLPEAVQ